MNLKLFLVAALAALATSFLAPQAHAHHSGAMYDEKKEVTIIGTVKEFAWTNPHVVLWVVANPTAGQPEQTWWVESTSPGNLTRTGWTKRTFKPGDRVEVVLNPLRNGQAGGWFLHALLVDTGQTVGGGNEPAHAAPSASH